MVYCADGIPVTEAVAAQQRLVLLLSNHLKQKYLEMFDFVRDRMSLVIVRYNTLFLSGASNKEAYARQRPNLEDGVVMALLAPWWG